MSEFAPPTERLAAVTRKRNELRALLDSSIRDENSIQIIYHEYKEKVEALVKAYEETELEGELSVKLKEWWQKNYSHIVNCRITVDKYLNELKGAIPKVVRSTRSKFSAYSDHTRSSTSSARVRLAEKKG